MMAGKAFDPETFDPWEDHWPDQCFKSAGQLNTYTCEVCGGRIVTIDRVDGVTPYTIGCRARVGCRGEMVSGFYRCPQDYTPTHEWVRPTKEEVAAMAPHYREHYWHGGLMLKPLAGVFDPRTIERWQ